MEGEGGMVGGSAWVWGDGFAVWWCGGWGVLMEVGVGGDGCSLVGGGDGCNGMSAMSLTCSSLASALARPRADCTSLSSAIKRSRFVRSFAHCLSTTDCI